MKYCTQMMYQILGVYVQGDITKGIVYFTQKQLILSILRDLGWKYLRTPALATTI
jgi:hypothetical protein